MSAFPVFRPRLALRPARLAPLLLMFALGNGVAAATVIPDDAVRLIDAGLFRRALPLIEPLARQHADDIELQFRFGDALLASGRVEEAVEVLAKVAAAAPETARYRRRLGEAYRDHAQRQFDSGASVFAMVRIMGVMRSAREEFEAAVRLDPDDLEALVDLATFHIVAPRMVGGDRAVAQSLLERIERRDPVRGLQVSAMAAQHADEPQRAEALLREAAARDGGIESQLALGLWLIDAQRYDEANALFRTLGQGSERPYLGWYQLGRIADLSQQNVEEGMAMLQRYIALEDLPDAAPSKGWAHYRLGNLHAKRGNREMARAQYQAAQAYAAGLPTLAKRLEDGAGASE